MDKICFCGHPHSAHVVGGLECLTPECLCKSYTVASSKLSPIPFVAAQQIYSAFSKFGPPHTESCSEGCTEHNWGKLPDKAWRVGRGGDVSSECAIYEGDKLIGAMDHAWDAKIAVLAVNLWKSNQEIRPTFEWPKEQNSERDLLDIIGAAHEALSHHDYDDPEHTITMHTKDLPDAYREACKALGAATRILCVEDVGGGTLADRGLVRLENVVKFLREREDKIRKYVGTSAAVAWDAGALIELKELIEELEGGALTK